jgi:hypothetical protein
LRVVSIGPTLLTRGLWAIAAALSVLFIPGLFHFGALIAQEIAASEQLLPANTRAWISVPNAGKLREAIGRTRFSQMSEDPEVKPFVEDMERQFRKFLDDQNVQFGLRLEDLEGLESGEICLAGILKEPIEGATEASPEHSIVLLVDVLDSETEARELLDRVAEEMTKREAISESMEFGQVTATKWTFPEVHGIRVREHAFHSIVGRWLIACDRESTFRDLVGRLGGVEAEDVTHLADNPVFQIVVENSGLGEDIGLAHVRWFVEPLGYMTLLNAIGDEEMGARTARNDHVKILREQGFSAIKGLGGVASFGTGKHEIVHRTFIYAPHSAESPFERGARMLDFTNVTGTDLGPPDWAPDSTASMLSITWNLLGALENVGYLADAIGGTDGSWVRVLDSIRDDPNGARVDLRKVAGMLENRITAIGVTELPINEDSERLIFGVKVRNAEDESYVAESLYRFVKESAQVIEHEGTRILLVDDSLIDDSQALDFDEDDFGDEFGEQEGDAAEEDDEFVKPKPLFLKKAWAVRDGYLLMSNNLEEMKSLITNLASKPGEKLSGAEDYRRINEALVDLTGEGLPSLRHFGRIDQAIRTNYEMLRTGKMGQARTVLAQLLNRAFEEEDAPPDAVRQQKFDGSKLPEDFEGKVAKYFGPTGMFLHSSELGWTITGCVLAKEEESTRSDVDPDLRTTTSSGSSEEKPDDDKSEPEGDDNKSLPEDDG